MKIRNLSKINSRLIEWFVVSLALLLTLWMLAFWQNRTVYGATLEQAPLAAGQAGLFDATGRINRQGEWHGTFQIPANQRLHLSATGEPRLLPAKYAAGSMSGAFQEVTDVYAIVASGNDVYFGGAFRNIGGIAARGVARYSLITGQWSPLGGETVFGGNGVNGTVYSILVIGSDVYVGGAFTFSFNRTGTENAVSSNCVAKWNSLSNTWSRLGSGIGLGKNGFNGDVFSMVTNGTSIFFAGSFQRAFTTDTNFIEANGVARWNLSGNSWAPLGKGVGSSISNYGKALLLVGNELYVGGSFPQVINPDNSVVEANNIAKWNTQTNIWTVLGNVGANANGTNGAVLALAANGSEILVGGEFREANTSQAAKVQANRIARWTGTGWNVFNGTSGATTNGFDSYVETIYVNNGITYIGGDFRHGMNGGGMIALNFIARWNGNTFSAFGSGVSDTGNGLDGQGKAFNMISGQLYVGGVISEAYNSDTSKVATTGVARWNGTSWSAFGAAAVKALTATSAASFAANELTAESIGVAFGTDLAPQLARATATPLPTSLAGTTVRLRDSQNNLFDLPLFGVAPRQVNFYIPAGVAAGPATLTINSGDGSVSQGTITIVTTAPGIFTLNSNGLGVGAANLIRGQNGAQIFEPLSKYAIFNTSWVPVEIDLGPATDRVFLALYGTGIRGRGTTPVTATIGGTPATVLFAGRHNSLTGVDQVNLEIPRSLIGRKEVDLVITIGTKVTNTVKVSIK